jgi:hypothetical protein
MCDICHHFFGPIDVSRLSRPSRTKRTQEPLTFFGLSRNFKNRPRELLNRCGMNESQYGYFMYSCLLITVVSALLLSFIGGLLTRLLVLVVGLEAKVLFHWYCNT